MHISARVDHKGITQTHDKPSSNGAKTFSQPNTYRYLKNIQLYVQS